MPSCPRPASASAAARWPGSASCRGFIRADFRTRSTEGVGDDWPLGYDDLRPYYEKVEREFGVAGECGPFAPEPYELPMPPHRMNWHAQVLARGARQLGAHPFAPPMAINSVAHDGRPACIYCGWCGSGCPTGAKATAANTYLAQAEQRRRARHQRGASCTASTTTRRAGRVTGVEYPRCRSGASIGSRRGSSCSPRTPSRTRGCSCSRRTRRFPTAWPTPAAWSASNFMSHPTWQVFGTFDEPVNAYKGMQMGHVMVQDYYKPDPRRGCARGFILLSYMMTPITYANLSGTFYGAEFKEFLHDYAHTAAWWAHAEGLPRRAQHHHARPGNEGRARPAGGARDLRMGRKRRRNSPPPRATRPPR